MNYAGVPQSLPSSVTYSNPLQPNAIQSVPTSNLLVSPHGAEARFPALPMLDDNERLSKKRKDENRSTAATTSNQISNYTGSPFPGSTPVHGTGSYSLRSHTLQHAPSPSTKIQIKYQPRVMYRPRTQNESRTSSHYIRCEEGVGADYPTIEVPQIWAQESDVNIIEVTLVDIKGGPHPYPLSSKTSELPSDDWGLNIDINQPNSVYFRLTNEDFLVHNKSFMIELLKSKQDEVITKKLIHERSLYQSMLRFTRIYRGAQGRYHYDRHNAAYSCIMTENYGNVSVEHMGPRFGPISGQELFFIVFKGRVVKDDLRITVSEPESERCHRIDQFMLNGTVVYFPMPLLPDPQRINVRTSVNVYVKNEELYSLPYLYTSSLDELFSHPNLAGMPPNDSGEDQAGNLRSTRATSQKVLTKKSRKRLS